MGQRMARILAGMVAVLCCWITLAIPVSAIAADVAADDMKESSVPRKALVIGVRRYMQWEEVPSAQLDATTIAERLGSAGFDVTRSINETTEDIYDKLRMFGKKLEPNDVAVIYYSPRLPVRGPELPHGGGYAEAVDSGQAPLQHHPRR